MSEPDRQSAGPADEDARLLSALATGDADALAALYDRHAAWMLGHAHYMLGGRRDAEDLVHDVFLEIWHKAASYDESRGGVRTWIRVRLHSRALDRLRSRAVARRHGLRRLVDGDDAEDPDSAAELFRCVDRTRVVEALRTLSEGQRTVIEMSYLQGMASDEIARRCGISPGTVKSRMSRGLAVLRERLVSEEPGA